MFSRVFLRTSPVHASEQGPSAGAAEAPAGTAAPASNLAMDAVFDIPGLREHIVRQALTGPDTRPGPAQQQVRANLRRVSRAFRADVAQIEKEVGFLGHAKPTILRHHENLPVEIGYSPNGALAFSWDWGRNVRLWNLIGPRPSSVAVATAISIDSNLPSRFRRTVPVLSWRPKLAPCSGRT